MPNNVRVFLKEFPICRPSLLNRFTSRFICIARQPRDGRDSFLLSRYFWQTTGVASPFVPLQRRTRRCETASGHRRRSSKRASPSVTNPRSTRQTPLSIWRGAGGEVLCCNRFATGWHPKEERRLVWLKPTRNGAPTCEGDDRCGLETCGTYLLGSTGQIVSLHHKPGCCPQFCNRD